MSKIPFNRREFLKLSGISTISTAGISTVASASGTSTATEIENWHQLDAIRDDLGDDYILVDDLDENAPGYTDHVEEPENGWEPIGTSTNPFSGTFYGDGFTISGLEVDTDRNGGLFGQTEVVDIGNLRLQDVEIIADGLAGGLIGRAGIFYNDRGEIFQVQVTGYVESKSDRAGGIVGRTREVRQMTDRNSFVGTVKGYDDTGGIVGRSSANTDVSGCYARGTVESTNGPAGGIVGSSSQGNSEFTQIYSAATVVSGVGKAGAVVGDVASRDMFLDSVYWNENLKSEPNGSGSGNVENWIPLSTSEMQGATSKTNMDNLNFDDLWQVVTDPDGYPAFQIEEPVVDPNTGDISGTISTQEGEPISDVECYLISSKVEYQGYDIIEQYPDLFPPDPVDELPAVGQATTNSLGEYEINDVVADRYVLVILPPFGEDLNPKLRDEVVVPADDSITIDLELAEGRPLAALDNEMSLIFEESLNQLDRTNEIAAEVFFDGVSELGETYLKESFEASDIPLGDAEPEPTENIRDELTNYLAQSDRLEVEAADNITDLLIELVDGLDVSQGDLLPLLAEVFGQLESEEWFTDFQYTDPEDEFEEIITDGYASTPIYESSVDTIDQANTNYSENIALQEPVDDFSLGAAKASLINTRQQVEYINWGVPGVVFTPEGDEYKIDDAETFAEAYRSTNRQRDFVGDLQRKAIGAKAIGGTLMFTKVGAPLGLKIMKVGAESYKALNVAKSALAVQQALEWAFTQVRWGTDLRRIERMNQSLTDWLENAVNEGTSSRAISIELDMNLNEHEDVPNPYIVANKPEQLSSTIFDASPVYAVETANIALTNEGDDEVDVRVTMGTSSPLGRSIEATMSPSLDDDPLTIPPNDTRTVELDYVGELGELGLPVQQNELSLSVWANGIPIAADTVDFQVLSPDEDPERTGMLAETSDSSTSPVTTEISEDSSSLVDTLRVDTERLFTDELTPSNEEEIVEHTHSTGVHRVRYRLTSPGFVALQVIDEDDRLSGYDPTRDEIVNEIPEASVSGPFAIPQVVDVPNKAGESYTVRAVDYRFIASTSTTVAVDAVEIPEREPILIASVEDGQAEAGPDEKATLPITVSEVGQQLPLESVDIEAETFTDAEDNPLDVEGVPSKTNFDISPNESTQTILEFDLPSDLDLPGAPENTRFTGEVEVSATSTPSVTLELGVLLLETEVEGAGIRDAAPTIEALQLSERDLDTIPEMPERTEPLAAYELTANGAGRVELEVPEDSGRSPVVAFTVEEGDLIKLDTGWGDNTVRFGLDVPNETELTAIEPIIIAHEKPEDERSVADYVGPDDIVRLDGLRAAIDDKRTGVISDDLLSDVTEAWRTQKEVN